MPNMEELLNQISVEITRDRTAQTFISKIDIDCACGQMKLSKETSRQGVFATPGQNSGDTINSKRGFTGWSIYPNITKELTEH